MDHQEIEHILGLAEGNWKPSTTNKGADYEECKEEDNFTKNAPSLSRTSYCCNLGYGHDSVVRRLETRVAALAGVSVDFLESLNLVRYHPGQFFKEHHDGACRQKTVFVYLNDIQDGGHTIFTTLGFKIRPVKGMAVMWPNINADGTADLDLMHEGEAPSNEVKYAINCFVNIDRLEEIVQ